MSISNEQRAHDLATSLMQTFTKENDDLVNIVDNYVGLYSTLLKDFDQKFPNGVPASFVDFPESTDDLIHRARQN